MIGTGRRHHQHFVDERAESDDEGARLQRRQSRHRQLHAVAGRPYGGGRHPRQRDRAGLLPDGAEPHAADESRTARSRSGRTK